MTDRHPFDCFITPPCAAIALGVWHGLRPRFRTALDPFAGPGTLVPWTGLAERAHASEIDPRWESEARANAATVHIGDSLSEAWLINGRVPHIITNPPYKLTRETIERARDHAYEHRRWACLLLRTDWWQHRNRSHLRPDHMLMLEWRPAFGLNSKLRLATDYAGYSWACWMPSPTGRTSAREVGRYMCVGCNRPYEVKPIIARVRRFAVALPAAGTVVCCECIDLMTEILAENRADFDKRWAEADAIRAARRGFIATLRARALS